MDAEGKFRESQEVENFIESKMKFSTPFVKACLVHQQDQSERLGSTIMASSDTLTIFPF